MKMHFNGGQQSLFLMNQKRTEMGLSLIAYHCMILSGSVVDKNEFYVESS